jgi:tetratricopeptide (TPR) repeat protein
MTSATTNSWASRIHRAPEQDVALAIIALALPWELLQCIPLGGLTLTKVAGLALIVSVGVRGVVERKRPFPRTGLEAPLALFFVICTLSAAFSNDRAASLYFLRIYATYALFFYAVATAVSTTTYAASLLRLYVLSAAAVALLSLFVAKGVLAPTYWATVDLYPARSLVEEWRSGSVMRVVAASADLNQGVFHFLLALYMCLFLKWRSATGWLDVLLRGGLILILFGGMVVSMSRSALLIALLGLLVFFLRSCGNRRVLGILLLVAAGGVTVFFFSTGSFREALLTRTQSLYAQSDSSVIARQSTYAIATKLLPSYALTGAGLGATDTTIEQSSLAEEFTGQTLHSVPLKMLFEMGVLGLLAYLWLWWRGVTTLLLHRRETKSSDGILAILSASAAAFAMLLVQPFMALSLYPFFAGIALGPPHARSAEYSISFASKALAVLAVGGLVLFNSVNYQRDLKRIEACGDALVKARTAEGRGQWSDARTAYEEAEKWIQGDMDFLDVGARVVDLPFVYRVMGLSEEVPNPVAACEYALGRIALMEREESLAADHFERAVTAAPHWSEGRMALGDVLWNRGDFATALSFYRPIESLEGLPEPVSVDDRLDLAHRLRRNGRWAEALECVQQALVLHPDSAESLFLLGVNAELEKDELAAKVYYQRACEILPTHLGAIRRLATMWK